MEKHHFTYSKAKTGEIRHSISGIYVSFALVLTMLFFNTSGYSQTLSPGSISLNGSNPVCKGKDPGIIISSADGTPAGDFSYQWQTESTPGNWVNIPFTSSSFDPGILNTTSSYRRLVIYNADNSITAASNVITISVTDVSAPIANATQFFCSAVAPSVSSLTATGTGLQWYSTEFGGSALAPGTALTNGTTYYVSQTSNGCESPRTAITATIYQTPTVTATPLTQTLCTGSLTNIALTSNVTGTAFNWTVNQTNVSGAAAGSGTSINQVLNTTGNVQGKATYTITPTANGCSGSPLPVLVSVNTKPQIIAQVNPANAKICTDETASFTVNISGSPQPIIQWQESANGSTWSDIPGATSNNYSFIAQANQKGFRYRTVLTNSCGTVTSNEGILDVSPPISIKTQPTSTSVCNGSTAVFFAEVIGQQTFTITTWQISNDGGLTWVNVDDSKVVTTTTGAENGVFLTTLTLNPTLAESGTKARVVFTNNCPVYSNEVGLTVTALPANPIVTGASRCGAGTVLLTAQPPVGSTIDWYEVSSGGSPVATGTNSFSTTNLTSTTTYYAVSRTLVSGCLSARVPVTATIKNIPTASVNNVTICNGSSATLTLTTNATSPVIAWTPTAGSLSSITVSPNTSTSYNVTVTDGITLCQTTASGTVYVNGTPAAPTAPSPVLYCMGASATFLTASGAGGNQLRWYSSATGGTPLASAPIPSTASTGTVSYWVSQVNNNNCEGPRTKIDVVVNGLPAITASPSTAICSGESITLTASGANSYSWVPTANLSSTTGNTVVASPTTTTTYSVTGTDANGCSNSANIVITVNPLPSITLDNQTICLGSSATLTASTNAASPTYSWTPTGQNSSSITVSPATSTNYTVNVTNGLTGCTRTASAIVTINPPATSVAGPPQTICAGEDISLSGFASGSTVWTTSGNGVFSPTASKLDAVYTPGSSDIASGSAILTLTTADPDGSGPCTTVSSTVVMTIKPLVTVNAGSPQSVCAGNSISLAGNIQGGTTSGIWSAPSGSFSDPNALNATYTPSITSGTVTLMLTSSDPPGPCGPVSATVVITVNPRPAANVSVSTLCSGSTATIKATPVAGNLSDYNYTWTVPSGATAPGNVTSFSATTPGTYTVILINKTTNCTSLPASGTLTSNPLLGDPIVVNNSRCGTGPVVLSATADVNEVVDWYNDPTTTTKLFTGNTYTTTSLTAPTVRIYYVEARHATLGCKSARVPVVATVYAIPPAPAVTDGSTCGPGTVTLSASGCTNGTYNWYAASSGGTSLFTGSSYSPVVSTTTSFWVSCTNENNCEGPRAEVIATVIPITPGIIGTDQVKCSGGDPDLLINLQTGTGGSGSAISYQWQSSIGGGAWSPITGATGLTYDPPAGITAGTSYRRIITSTKNGAGGYTCTLSSNVVTVNVNPLPSITPSAIPNICLGTTSAILSYTNATNGGNKYSITWNASAISAGFINLVNADLTPGQVTIAVPTTATTTTYTGVLVVSNSNTGCLSSSYPISITINPLPVCTITGNNNICPGSTNTYAAPSGMTSYNWNITGNGTITGSTISNSVSVTSGATCGTFTLSLTITNANGCTNSCSSTFTVSDNIKPTVTGIPTIPSLGCNPPDPTTAFVTPTAVDNCNTPTLQTGYPVTSGVTTVGCVNTQTRTWVFVDACGNESLPFIQTISWTSDNTKPLLSGTAAIPFLGCNPSNPTTSFVAPTATDNCGIPVLKFGYPITQPVSTTGCNNEQSRTWIYVDACGNESEPFTQTITWTTDLTKPIVTGIATIPSLGCNPANPVNAFVTPTATDDCGIPVLKSGYPVTSTVITTGCTNTQTRTWIYVDGCGNESSAFVQTINWTSDLVKPVLTGITAIPHLGCNPANPTSSFIAPTVTENCGTVSLKNGYPITSTVSSTNCNNSQTRTWIYVDGCGNESDAFTQTITWTSDQVKPAVTGLTAIPNLGCNPVDPTAAFIAPSATDNCGIPILKTGYPITSTVTTVNCVSIQNRTWIYMDACGNESEPFMQTIIWTTDQTKPTVSCPAPQIFCISPNNIYTVPALTATDNCSNVTVSYAVSGATNRSGTGTDASGSFNIGVSTITWTVTDGCNNFITCSTTVTVNDETVPLFNAIAPICIGSSPVSLPNTSNNGIVGTWSPSTINTAVPGTTTYIFTPATGLCAATTTMDITIRAKDIPTFNSIDPICKGAVPPTLPLVSNNNITGSWNATINTATSGKTIYTFTPASGECATTTTIEVMVNEPTVPSFDPVGPFCKDAPVSDLPSISKNNITGTWDKALTTSSVGKTTYTFTPAPGQCAVSTSIEIEIADQVTPSFDVPGPYCIGATPNTLPLTSKNGIKGTWFPTAVNTTAAGNANYTFTPNADQCGVPTTINIEVTSKTIPDFDPVGPFCKNAPVFPLPVKSKNNITGTWNKAISTASPGKTIYTFTPEAGQCATTATLEIEVTEPIVPLFDAVGPYCKNAAASALPATSKNNINGTWDKPLSTATVGKTTYTFTPTAGACATSTTIEIEITEPTIPLFDAIGPYCKNAIANALPSSSKNGITGSWDKLITTASVGKSTYIFTPVAGQCATPTSIEVEVTEPITPTFDPIGPYCKGVIAAALPSLSNNGISGTWDKAISTAAVGKTIYTFTPAVGQCASATTIEVEIADQVLPVFNPIGPYCVDAVATILPLTSINGITGTWDKILNTATVGKTSYTFTPAAGQCGAPVTVEVDVTSKTVPIFDPLGPLCKGTTPPLLPTLSNNGIAGTWNTTINTTSAGKSIYIFTPAAGQCATDITLEIEITEPILTAFDPIGALCKGSATIALATTSKNGVTGNWDKAINTSTPGKTIHLFTPTTGQCATNASLEVNVTDLVTPTFDPFGPYCKNAPAAALPTTSKNNIAGTWDKALSTSSIGTTTYTFTPSAGQCAIPISIDVEIADQVIPTFSAFGPYCRNATPALLPSISGNGITGTWTPSTISTTTAGKTSYTFTPAAGQCGAPVSIEIDVNEKVTPTFDAVGPFCKGSTAAPLPTISKNGISGTWDKIISTSSAGTTTYTFTPANNPCAVTITLDIIVTEQVAPIFSVAGPYCEGSTPPALPGISNNGIKGSWNNAINTSNAGTTTYTFTPDPGQCSGTTTMDVTIQPQITPIFDKVGPYCLGAPAAALPTISKNGIMGTWNKAISTSIGGTSTYTFTPSAGQCANLVTLDVEVNNEVTPVFDQLGPYCLNAPSNALPSISNNGIKGSWDKSISTATLGATTYSFTPDPGQCGIPVTMTITVTDKIVPAFDAVAPYCKAATPDALPKTSTNGITGTWDKSVSTSVIGTASYKFTPDPGQCATTATLEIVTENCCAVELAASATEINCTTSSSIITAIATKGKAPYEFSLDGGSYQLANTFSSGPGNFKITVKDANGCTAETFVTVTETISDLSAAATAPEITCSENLGTITVNALNGNAPFAYAINGGSFQNGNAFANLPPGSYKITVKDATGCTTTLDATLNKTSTDPNLVVSDPASVCAPGTIDLTKSEIVTGSDPGLTYSYWTTPAATQPVNNANDIKQSGTYYIKAENSNGCSSIKPVKISILTKPILNISEPASSCYTVDLTASAITSGSNKGLSFTYWSDSNATNSLIDPDKISLSGTYYIKASSSTGCSDTQPVQVTILALPALTISNPAPVCAPSVIDITSSLVTAGSDAGLVFTYWKDDQSTQKLTDPGKIGTTGTYFIKGTSANGCFAIKPVNAVVNSFPVLAVTEPAAVCFPATIDITAASVTKGSEAELSLTYWKDPAATLPLVGLGNISQSATYYIKGTTQAGCYDIKPVKIIINALPIVSITDPAPVCSPLRIDLTAPAYTQGSDNNLVFSYWKDEKATLVMANPSKVDQSGTYYIKGTASTGCYVTRPIQVTINRLPTLNVINPPDACTPSTVDITWSSVTAGSDGDLTYSYWTDRSATLKLNSPTAISESGTYFIKVVNSNSCTTVKEVQVVINPLPTLSIKAPDSLCIGLSTDISIGFSGQAPWSFTYNDGSQNLVVNNIRSQPYLLRVEPKQTTTYTITSVSDRFCTNRNPENNKATIQITYPIPGIRHVPVTTTANTPVILKGREIPGYKYNWDPRVGLNNPALARPTFNYNQLVEYKINMVSSAGCLTIDTMMVRVSNATVPDSPCDFFTPNVFSPNGDGRNDTYFPFTVNIKSIKFFRIFNRWGELVFETKRFGEGWNGMYKGKKQPIDAYVWTAEAICEDGTTVRQSGNVLLAK